MIFTLAVCRTQLVEAQFTGTPAANRKYNFTDIPNLSRNNIVVFGFEAITATQLAVTPTNLTVITAADSDQIVITLRDNKKEEFVYQYPYYSAIKSLNGGFPVTIQPRIINLTDCCVQCTDASGISSNEVAVLVLYYDLLESILKRDPGFKL